MSTEIELVAKLRDEGFGCAYIWEDGPNAYYPDHTHRTETAHIILCGEITLTIGGRSKTYRSGERCDVPADMVHSARVGPQGCRYLIGER